MQQLILILHVLAAIAIIALVLMQHGRGADVGAAFGSGSSNTMFGSAGALPFLMKVTAVCATIFFATSISLSYLSVHAARQTEIIHIPTSSSPPLAKTTTPLPAKENNVGDAGVMFTPAAPTKSKP